MKYKVGDKVILTNGDTMTVRQTNDTLKWYFMREDPLNCYTDEMIEGLVEEETLIERVDDNGLPFNEWLSHKGAFYIPDGYELKDDNGNVINAKKIVLEKKKKEYPKTYEECLSVLGIYNGLQDVEIYNAKPSECTLFESFIRLKRCRDAYWKIYGEEMGLDGPWSPDWNNDSQFKYIIICRRDNVIKDTYTAKNCILAFPTAEMRDAFYENFKELIENCKELL